MRTTELIEAAKQNQDYMSRVEKATWAYHWDRKDHPHAHSFLTGKLLPDELKDHVFGNREISPKRMYQEQCTVCGRTRYEIRNDSLDGHCIPTTVRKPISEVLLQEETRFLDLLNSAETKIPQLLEEKFNGVLDSAALFYLQSTTGYPPDVVAMFYDEREIEKMMPGFERLMDEHRKKSGEFKK